MKALYYLIALVMLSVGIVIFSSNAEAGGPWDNQYCDVETTTIRVIDTNGNTIEERTEEKVTCNDGAKDFLHGMGIADSCEQFTYKLVLNGIPTDQRAIACRKLNGEYEIVKGYHYIN